MGKRLSIEQVEEARALIAAGEYTDRAIAETVGISKGSVYLIRTGQYRDKREPVSTYKPPSGPYVYCPDCGANVQQPCLACYLRKGKT